MIYDVLLVVVLGGIGLSGGRGGVRNILVGTLLVGVLLDGMTILDIAYSTQNLIKSIILLLRHHGRQHHQSTRRTDCPAAAGRYLTRNDNNIENSKREDTNEDYEGTYTGTLHRIRIVGLFGRASRRRPRQCRRN